MSRSCSSKSILELHAEPFAGLPPLASIVHDGAPGRGLV